MPPAPPRTSPPPPATWNGTLLLGTLLRGIVHALYRDLCAHTLWALLLLRRPHLTSPRQLPAIKTAVFHALQTGTLAPSARQPLEQVSYLRTAHDNARIASE